MKIRIDMGYYFSLDDLKREMMDSCFYSQRFESLLTFKLDSLRELCGRLPEENEIFFIETHIYLYRLPDQADRPYQPVIHCNLFHQRKNHQCLVALA